MPKNWMHPNSSWTRGTPPRSIRFQFRWFNHLSQTIKDSAERKFTFMSGRCGLKLVSKRSGISPEITGLFNHLLLFRKTKLRLIVFKLYLLTDE